MTEVKEYLSRTAGTEGQLLIERKIYDTLISAAQKNMIGRGLASVYMGPSAIPGSSIDVNLVDPDSMTVFKVAEGAAIPIDVAGYTNTNFKPDKYAVRPLITKEMMEDGKWDLLAHNVQLAGVEMAENEDSLILTVLTGATNVVAGGAAITIANITRAMQYLEDADYKPTDLLVGPEVANDLRNIDTFVEADKLGSREAFENGLIGKIFGMDVRVFSANIGTTTNAYVLDRRHAFGIAEKRPLTVEEYDEVSRDLSGAVVTQRIKVKLLRDTAVCRITTS